MAKRECNWTNHNPLTDLRALKEPAHRNRRISPDELDQLLTYFKFKEEKPTLQKQVVAIIFLLAQKMMIIVMFRFFLER